MAARVRAERSPNNWCDLSPTNRRKVRSFLRASKVTYPVLLGDRKTKALFDAGETLPFSVVLDREGKVRENIEGILLPEEFDEKIKPLLERPQQ